MKKATAEAITKYCPDAANARGVVAQTWRKRGYSSVTAMLKSVCHSQADAELMSDTLQTVDRLSLSIAISEEFASRQLSYTIDVVGVVADLELNAKPTLAPTQFLEEYSHTVGRASVAYLSVIHRVIIAMLICAGLSTEL